MRDIYKSVYVPSGSNHNKFKQSVNSISVIILIEFRLNISPILCDLINDCFVAGEYPVCFKKTSITPIFEASNQNDVKNYRPISILPLLNKVMDKCMQYIVGYIVS